MDVSPATVLAMWTGGMAGGGAIVAWWRVVGPGFTWLTGAVVALFGIGVAVFAEEPTGYVGVAVALGAMIVARNQRLAAAFFATSAVVLFVAALSASTTVGESFIPTLTGTVFLGAITAEMMLGHWYLVDPRLPRWALQRLDLVAGAGLDNTTSISASGTARPKNGPTNSSPIPPKKSSPPIL